MKKIKVNLKERSYPIIVGSGLLTKTGKLLKCLPNTNKAFVITNKNIKRLYGAKLTRSLHTAGIELLFSLVTDSEKSKSINTWARVVNQIAKFDKGKGVVVIALGGGVIGDLSGFVAASYRRGVALIQIPTTLLAQVDSAIGGKTAVDLRSGKNLVGAFYQPKLVVADLDLIKSLPLTEVRNALSEIIKYGVILDKTLFSYLEKYMSKLLKLSEKHLAHVVSRCAQLKAEVVSLDEKETIGYRTILNFGHTIGHALEAAASYSKKISHGAAVAIGMLCASDISVDLGLMDAKSAQRLEGLIKKAGLPAMVTGLKLHRILNAMSYDKKIIAGKLRFILPAAIGHVIVCKNINNQLIKKAIKKRIS